MARQTARSADQIQYEGTTEEAWTPPDLSDYADAMGAEDVSTTGDLAPAAKRRIAAMTLMGEARASRFDELQSYPVTEAGGALNRNALDAARRLRGQSSDPAGIERVTRRLLNEEFDAGIEKPSSKSGSTSTLLDSIVSKSVGGIVTETIEVEEGRLWVNTVEPGTQEEVAIYVDPDGEEIRVGDSLWWHQDAFWTPRSEKDDRQDVTLEKLSNSGVNRPQTKDRTDEEWAERIQAGEEQTNFPNDGDDDEPVMQNSEYDQPDGEFVDVLKEEHPEIWDAGGNQRGNDAYEMWRRYRDGERSDAVKGWMYVREDWAARHSEDGGQFNNDDGPEPVPSNVGGVVAQMKWGVVPAGDGTLTAQQQKDAILAAIKTIEEREEEDSEKSLVDALETLRRLMHGRKDEEISNQVEEALREKAEEHNEEHADGQDDAHRVTYGMLADVFRRGVGAYNTNPESVRPNVDSPEQWAYARVNSFLYAVRNENFQGGEHDRDLMPESHPLYSESESDSDKRAAIKMDMPEQEPFVVMGTDPEIGEAGAYYPVYTEPAKAMIASYTGEIHEHEFEGVDRILYMQSDDRQVHGGDPEEVPEGMPMVDAMEDGMAMDEEDGMAGDDDGMAMNEEDEEEMYGGKVGANRYGGPRKDTLVTRGQGLKMLSDVKADGTVEVGGYGILFTGPDDPDLDGQFFTAESDFWLDGRKDAAAWAIYGHGMDEVMGVKRLSPTPWKAEVDEAGVWMEGQLEIADKYDEMLVEKGIKPGKMGLSTGVPPHLVRTEQKGGAEHIKTWPFAEVSITPQPAEPATREPLGVQKGGAVTPLKGLSIPSFKSVVGASAPAGKALSTDQKIDKIRQAWLDEYDTRETHAHVAAVYLGEGHIIGCIGETDYRVPMTLDGGEVEFANRAEWVEVMRETEWQPVEDGMASLDELAKTATEELDDLLD
ncbi:hypothetical protein [Salinibacter phage 5_12]